MGAAQRHGPWGNGCSAKWPLDQFSCAWKLANSSIAMGAAGRIERERTRSCTSIRWGALGSTCFGACHDDLATGYLLNEFTDDCHANVWIHR
uniref:Uncharacterized protein n=1 Tax=Oryza glaberrima TaxID=4538 RepID=I1P3E3_ORYGL